MTMNTDVQTPLAPGPRADAADRLKIRLLMGLLLVFAPMALYVSGAIVILLFALLAAGLWAVTDRLGLFAIPSNGHGWLLALLVYALLSVGWARDSREAFYDWWRIALIIGSGWLLAGVVARLPAALCRYLLRGVLWGVVLLVAMLLVEWLSGGVPASWVKQHDTSSLLFTSRASALLAVLLWPTVVFCWYRQGRRLALAVLVLGLIEISALPLLAAVVAVLVAALVFALHYAWPRMTPRILGVVFLAVVLAAPWAGLQIAGLAQSTTRIAAVEQLPSSWRHRLVIWEFFARRIQASPWLGHGLGTAHGLGQVASALQDYQRVARPLGTAKIVSSPPLHPHNAALQLWHDLGLVGVLVLCVWVILAVRGLLRRSLPRSTVAASLACFTSWLVIAGLSFGLWQKWWLASGAISIMICLLLVRGLNAPGDPVDA